MKVTFARVVCATVVIAACLLTLSTDHPPYAIIESTLPLAIFSIGLVVLLERTAGDPTATELWRAPALLGVAVGAFVMPWILSAIAVAIAFEWYGRMPVRPYASWDVYLTYVLFANAMLMYLAALLILLGFGIQTAVLTRRLGSGQ